MTNGPSSVAKPPGKVSSRTELKIGDDGVGFGVSSPGPPPGNTESPLPIVIKRRFPRSANPDGPDGSPAGLPPRKFNPDGSPLTSVCRAPDVRSTIESLPVFGIVVPASADRKSVV